MLRLGSNESSWGRTTGGICTHSLVSATPVPSPFLLHTQYNSEQVLLSHRASNGLVAMIKEGHATACLM